MLESNMKQTCTFGKVLCCVVLCSVVRSPCFVIRDLCFVFRALCPVPCALCSVLCAQ